MNKTDLLKAKNLSKQVAGLGLRPKYVAPVKVKVKTPFKFSYEALKTKNGTNGKDGKTPTTNEILALIKPLVQQALAEMGKPVMEVTDDVVKAIVQKMHTLPENDKLEVSKGIRNAQSFIYKGTKYGMEEMMHGGSASSSVASTSVYGEIVAGSGTAWTLAHTPSTGTLRLFANGQRLTETVDYTLSGAAVTTLSSWSAGTLLADYQYA